MFNIDLTASKIVWVLVALLAFYTIYWLIRSLKDPYYPSVIRIILAILRTAAIVIFIIIFLDIKITHIRDRQVEPEIAFLWDLSQSMNSQESEVYKASDILRKASYRAIDRQTSISHITDMQDPKIVSETQLKALSLNEAISDNGILLRFAEQQARFSELILISDGRSYIGEDLKSIRLLDKLILHTVGVGSAPEAELLELRSVNFPDHVLQGDSISISWALENPSEESINTKLIIKKNDEDVFKQEIDISAQQMMNILLNKY